ncbi:MAG TPA: phosphoserine phosphatase SerB [Stellaceae bacterium]|nr:phosphoserine phosphatase SerB [Stellaceae bacterium]
MVLTLVAAPGAAEVEVAAQAAVDALRRLGARVSPITPLAEGIACDIPFDDLDADQADAAARAALDFRPGIDLVAQPEAGRRKRLLVADMEATIIENEMLDELAAIAGIGPEIAQITRRAMNDEIDFATALRQRVALLKGLPESALAEAEARIRVTPGARELVATMRANGAYTVLVSGGFGRYSGGVRDALGFDRDIANELIIEEGRIAGRLREPILGRDAKLESLKRVAAEQGLPLAATLAVGDGANDMAMVAAAGLGVAFHAKPALRQRARCLIDHADLTALLYVQGYRDEEIVRGACRAD